MKRLELEVGAFPLRFNTAVVNEVAVKLVLVTDEDEVLCITVNAPSRVPHVLL